VSQKIKIYLIFFIAMFCCFMEHYAATKTTLLLPHTMVQDTILIDEEEAEMAFANAKYFYDDMFYHLLQHFISGIWKLKRNYQRFNDAEDDLELALTFYTAIKDEEKIKALRKMSNKSTTYLLLSLFLSIYKLASIFGLLLLLGGGGITIAVALFVLPVFLLIESVLFGLKKIIK
jgi:hypothetical protein